MFVYVFFLVMMLTIFVYREMVLSRAGSAMLQHKGKTQKTMLYIVLAILLFIATFRADHIGADHRGYVLLFQSIENTGTLYFAQNGEVGYVLLNRIAHSISSAGPALNFFVAVILIIGFYIYVTRQVEPSYWWMAILIFVLHPYLYIQSTFNAMRQCCAMGIIMLAACALERGKHLRFVLLTVIAATFHKSALTMLLLLVIRIVPWRDLYLKLIALVMVALNFLPTEGLVSALASVLGYEGYANYETSFLNNKIYVLFIVVVLFALLSQYDKLYSSPQEKMSVDIYLLSLMFLLLAVKNDMLYRIYIYLAFLSIPGATIICKNAKRFVTPAAVVKYLYVGYYSGFYIGYVALLWINQNQRYVPFQFVWNT